MSPRPRTASDQDILAATHRVISTVGPRFTLADVAKEVGLSPATLLQRFQSKKGLMVALASASTGDMSAQMAAIRKNASGPLDAVLALADCFAQMAPSPEVLANHLAFLQMDLIDPEMHALSLDQAKAMRMEMRKLLDDAVAVGELIRDVDTTRLATAIQSMQGGSLMSWAILREGNARRFVRRDLEMLIDPYRRRGKSKTRSAR